MFRNVLIAGCLGLTAVVAAADDRLLDHDDMLATAVLPESFQLPDDLSCCVGDTHFEATLDANSPVPTFGDGDALKVDLPSSENGLVEFVRECADMEVIPLKSIHDSQNKRMMVGVDFDGVLGVFVFTR